MTPADEQWWAAAGRRWGWAVSWGAKAHRFTGWRRQLRLAVLRTACAATQLDRRLWRARRYFF